MGTHIFFLGFLIDNQVLLLHPNVVRGNAVVLIAGQLLLGRDRTFFQGISALAVFTLLLLEELRSKVHLPELFSLLQGWFLPQTNGLDFVLFHQFGDGHIEEHQLPYDICDIHLARGFITCLLKLLDLWPVRVHLDEFQELFDKHHQEVEDTEGLWGNLLLIIINHDLLSQTQLVGLLRVRTHDEDQSDNGAHKSTDIGEIGVYFVECSLILDRLVWFLERDFYIGKCSCFWERQNSHSIRHVCDSLGFDYLPGH